MTRSRWYCPVYTAPLSRWKLPACTVHILTTANIFTASHFDMWPGTDGAHCLLCNWWRNMQCFTFYTSLLTSEQDGGHDTGQRLHCFYMPVGSLCLIPVLRAEHSSCMQLLVHSSVPHDLCALTCGSQCTDLISRRMWLLEIGNSFQFSRAYTSHYSSPLVCFRGKYCVADPSGRAV
jgi:hypothetical protein